VNAATGPRADSRDSNGTDGRAVAWLLLRAGLVPALVVDCAVIVAAAVAGGAELAGAAVGTLLTVAAFGVGPVLLRYARNVEPVLMFALAVGSYLTVTGVLAVAYALLSEASWLHGSWIGAAILGGAAAWLAGQVRATAKLRVLTFGDQHSPG
jgi:hypothetical protein